MRRAGSLFLVATLSACAGTAAERQTPAPVTLAAPAPPAASPLHPDVALGEAGATAIARQWALARGAITVVERAERRGDAFAVALRQVRPAPGAALQVVVDARTGEVSSPAEASSSRADVKEQQQ
ncbi:MAG: hypothetical protein ACK4N5_01450 [Myxococcales bacterium]